jgi:ATP-dependent DNA helicase RecG
MALPVNIDDLISARTVESARIEFKKGWNPEEVVHSICAFANDICEFGSGYILIGIEEKDGVAVLPPSGLNDNQIDPIQKELINLCFKIHPNIFPVVEPILFQGKHILIIWISTGEERPYYAPISLGTKGQSRIYVRPSSVTIPATPELEAKLRELATYKHFDDRVNTRASLNDLDLGQILSYLQEVKSQLYNDAPKMSIEDLSIKMQIARGQKENIKPLNVGLLLFCKEPERFFEGCRTNLVEFEDEAGIKYSEKIFKGPVQNQIRQIMEYLDSSLIKQYNKKESGKQEIERFFNYPYQAVEEAVVNALYHRSYENPTPNEIRIYKSGTNRRIEILSYPGPLPPIDNIALQQLKVIARNYRNIRLGDWLKNLRLAEKYATGIPTMVESLKRNESPLLSLLTDEARTYFLATLKIHPDSPHNGSSEVKEIEHVTLSDLQQSILESIKDEPLEVSKLKKKFPEDITKEIKILQTKELLKYKSINKFIFFKTKVLFITEKGIGLLKVSF